MKIKPFVVLPVFLAAGCSDPLEPAELVEEVRVLAARVEVAGDPARAAPALGERASVRWLVAAPEQTAALGWAFTACVAATTNVGVPRCQGQPFASVQSAAQTPGEPRFDFEVPATLDLETTTRAAVLGVICPDGSPADGALTGKCTSGSAGLRVSLEFELARANDVNTNPAFADPAVLLDGQGWAAPADAEPSCESADVPQIAAGSATRTLRLELGPDARDALPRETPLDPEREQLSIGHFSTAGELDRPFSNIAADAAEASVDVRWKPPARAPEAGTLVRFWFVARDLRGGSDYLERTLCVTP